MTMPGTPATPSTPADGVAGLVRRRGTAPKPGVRRVLDVMGMPVTVDLRDALPDAELERLVDAVSAWLVGVDKTFSTYRADSAISRIGRGETVPEACAPEVGEVLTRCAELRAMTDGYFDANAGGTLDPSGLVKGWAVEQASRLLVAGGSRHHCVNAGGDVRTRGDAFPGGGSPLGSDESDSGWHIGIRHPSHPAAVCCVLAGRDLAVATSAAYERGAHILDPHTGLPPRTPVASVTVTGPDLGTADAYATAAYAMGAACPDWLAAHLPDPYAAYVATADSLAWHTPGLPVIAGG